MVVICLLIMVVNALITPFESSLLMFQASMVVNGFFSAGVVVAVIPWILEMWDSAFASSLCLMISFSYTLAQGIIASVSAPFLSSEGHHNMSVNVHVEKKSMIIIPYSFAAAVGLSVALLILLLRYRFTQHVKHSGAQIMPPLDYGSCHAVPTLLCCDEAPFQTFHKVVIVLGCLTFCFYSGMEYMVASLLPQYLVTLGVSKSTADFMLSASNFSSAVVRGILIPFISRFNSKMIMCVIMFLLVLGNGLFLTLGNISKPVIWISLILIGCGFAPFQSVVQSFMEERIKISNAVSGCMTFGAAVANIVNTILVGQMLNSHPESFIWVCIISLFLCGIPIVGLHVNDVVRKRQQQNYCSLPAAVSLSKFTAITP